MQYTIVCGWAHTHKARVCVYLCVYPCMHITVAVCANVTVSMVVREPCPLPSIRLPMFQSGDWGIRYCNVAWTRDSQGCNCTSGQPTTHSHLNAPRNMSTFAWWITSVLSGRILTHAISPTVRMHQKYHHILNTVQVDYSSIKKIRQKRKKNNVYSDVLTQLATN